jgi:hypothetical protein
MMTNADPDVLSARHPLVALSDIRIAFRTPNQTGEIQILDGLLQVVRDQARHHFCGSRPASLSPPKAL